MRLALWMKTSKSPFRSRYISPGNLLKTPTLTGWFFHTLSGHEPSDMRLEEVTKDVAVLGNTLLQHSLEQLGSSHLEKSGP